jgi:hypothetical protein
MPDDLHFDYTYTVRNQLGKPGKLGTVTRYRTDDGGRRTRVTRPGSYIEYVYNARDWITAVRNRTTGGTVRYDASYYYNDGALWDHTGNPLKRVENFGGSGRGLVDASATVTDTYDMDTFGRPIGSTPNPYRYGAAWGYITDATLRSGEAPFAAKHEPVWGHRDHGTT